MEIRGYTIIYAKRKAKRKRDEEFGLIRRLNELHRKDLDIDSHYKTLLNKYYNSKIKLEKYQDQKKPAFIFRSKVRWYEHGEQNNCYSYNLVTRN